MSFALDESMRRCVIRLTGTIGRDDLLAGIESQVASGAWTWQTLIDTTAATGITTDYTDSRRVLGYVETITSTLPPRGPVVIIVGKSEAIYGMARQYQTMAEGQLRVAVVRDAGDVETAFAQLPAA